MAWWWVDPSRALWVAVAVLVVTCPCALSLAAPAALTSAARAYAREGVLIQRLAAIEDLAAIDQMLFDKTGTLTHDRLSLAQIRAESAGLSQGAALSLASTLAAWSRHPASRALVEAASAFPAVVQEWAQVKERPGLGMEAVDEHGRRWRLGRRQWVCDPRGDALGDAPGAATGAVTGQAPGGLTLAFGPVGQPLAEFDLQDTVRPDAERAVRDLRALGVTLGVMSGDAPQPVAAVATALGLPVLLSGAMPEEKKAVVAKLQQQGHVVAMVGDGINDAPVSGQAEVSIAMGHGSAATVARADFVVVPPNLHVLPHLVKRARLTQAVIRQNLRWALVYNLSAIPLALVGWLPPWAAGLGMTLSSLLVVFNSSRAGLALRD
jgi:Cu2+-exporting ATPase